MVREQSQMIAGPHKHSGEDGQAMPVSIALARTLYDLSLIHISEPTRPY